MPEGTLVTALALPTLRSVLHLQHSSACLLLTTSFCSAVAGSAQTLRQHCGWKASARAFSPLHITNFNFTSLEDK
jgi:hypothetical protein